MDQGAIVAVDRSGPREAVKVADRSASNVDGRQVPP